MKRTVSVAAFCEFTPQWRDAPGKKCRPVKKCHPVKVRFPGYN